MSRPFCYVPSTVSKEAQQYLASASAILPLDAVPSPQQIAGTRSQVAKMLTGAARSSAQTYFSSTRNATINRVPVAWGVPKTVSDASPSRGVIVYLHGGGYYLGSCASMWATVALTASLTGVPVVCPEYRLAPEHPFPAGLEDAAAVYRGLLAQGYPAGKILLVGDSAGGGMVAALTIKLQQARLPLPGALGLLSPASDICSIGDTMATMNTIDPLISLQRVMGRDPCSNALAQLYLGGNKKLAANPLVSPLRADYTKLFPRNTLPPTLIQVGLREVLLSQSVLQYHKMKAAAPRPGNVVLSPYEAMFHVWQGQLSLPEARAAHAELAAFFRAALARRATCA